MKGKEKENLINLALVYNYLVNKTDEIDIYVLKNYLFNIDKILKEKKYGKIYAFDEIVETINYSVSKDDYGKYVKLEENSVPLEWLYHDTVHDLEDYFLNISLQSEVLKTLNIKREDLPIETYNQRNQDTLEIYSLSKHNAICLARKYLEMDGMKNIQVNGATPMIVDKNNNSSMKIIGYNVYVTYDFVFEYLDIDKFKDYKNENLEYTEKRLVKKWKNSTK